MKKYLLFVATFFILIIDLRGQLVGVTNELVATGPIGTSYPAGYSTYRIYAHLQDPTDFLAAVYGSVGPDHSLVLGSTQDNSVWNMQMGVLFGGTLNCSIFPFFPEMAWDSFITVGRSSSCDPGTNNIFVVSTPPNLFQATFTATSFTQLNQTLEVDDGAYFIPNGEINGFPTGNCNRILIAQLTVPTGTLMYALNIQIFDEGIGADQLFYCHNLQDAPGINNGYNEIDGSNLGLAYNIPDDLNNYIPGCTDPTACNFLPAATFDDCTCTYPGCTDPEACNYDYDAGCDDGSCLETSGCMNPEACNFDPEADCPDSSCTLPGCLDPLACNYNSSAGCDNGLCQFTVNCSDPESLNYEPGSLCSLESCLYSISGIVFNDENGNVFFDSNEYGLGAQTLILNPGGIQLWTNDQGVFLLPDLVHGNYQISVLTSDVFPYCTTGEIIAFEVGLGGSNIELEFGLSSELPVYDLNVSYNVNGNPICSAYLNYHVNFVNQGNESLEGIVIVEFNEFFQGYLEITPIDSVVGNEIYMSYDNLDPGETIHCYLKLQHPSVSDMGEIAITSAKVFGYIDDELVAFGEDDISFTVACSYDPNDKQCDPVGYSDEHYILNGTELEYLVRFQNTGTAPAYNVVITDTLDNNLDASTFEFRSSSHSVNLSYNPVTRALAFSFIDIMLPDSTADEPGSHGFVSYKVSPYNDLEPGEQIMNTAHIYFDFNEAVITNTTWHTIYECTGQSDFNVIGGECSYEPLGLHAMSTVVDSYEWFANNELIGTNQDLEYTTGSEGTFEILLETSNPLCTVSEATSVMIDDVAGDFNCNDLVTVEDLNLFIGAFGCSGSCGVTDMNHDDLVNISDLLEFIGTWP